MRRARSSALVLLGSLFALAGACSTSTAPLGQGDDFISDIDAADATSEKKAAGVQACRTIAAALGAEPGKPLVLPGMPPPVM